MGLFIIPYIVFFGPILLPMYIYERFKDNVEDTFEYISSGLKWWDTD